MLKVSKIMERYAAATGQEMTLLTCERFQEDRRLFLAEFISSLYIESISEATFVTFRSNLRGRERVAVEAVLMPVRIGARCLAGGIKTRNLLCGQVPADCA